MERDVICVLAAGDLVLDEPNADYWLAELSPKLREADLSIGHLEVPHTGCEDQADGDIPAPGAPFENLPAIARAGFGMVSLAGNHIADCGPQGIADTIDGLDRCGVLHAGAGSDIDEARAPAIAEVKGRRVALLSYNCVGPEFSWAGAGRAGCAYLPIGTSDGSPITPRADLQSVLPEALEILEKDISGARARADFVIVALHKGIVHTPARLAPYERPIAQAAIDRGADAVLGHHAHIVRGIEFHDGRPIFHGLGNGCVVTRALSPGQDHPARAEWARKRREIFGFEPDPSYHLAPFHPEAVNAFLARLEFGPDGEVTAGLVPFFVAPPGRPTAVEGTQARAIFDYIEHATVAGGLSPIRILDDGRIAGSA